MDKILISKLTKLEDYEFFILEHHFQIARMVRDTMSKNAIPENVMAEHLGVNKNKIKAIINGAYPFDLMFVSKIQALNQSIAANNAKIRVEAQDIGFVKYKDQYPMYVERIERLLTVLEKEHNIKQ